MKNLKITFLFLFATLFVVTSQAQIPFSKGRIAISSDGNKHDNDDWGATAASLALLAKAGLQDKLVVYTYSDHIWGSEGNDLAQMRTSALGGRDKWKFTKTNFIEAATNKEKAYNAMRDAINASSSGNPLFIVCAGPMHVVGTAMSRASYSKRQYVTLISHSFWNDKHSDNPSGGESHSGWTWNEMKSSFGNAKFIHITDQNSVNSKTKGFNTEKAGPNGSRDWASWYWMRDHSDANVKWLYARMKALGRPDISDCGIVWYLLKNDQNGNPAKMKSYIGGGISVPGGGTGGGNETIVHIKKRNASRYAIDGGNGGKNGQNVYLWTAGNNNVNQQWVQISRGNGYYSLKKKNTNYCLDGGNGGKNGQNVYLWNCNAGNQNQHWKKISVGSGNYRLEKRNASAYSIDGGNGGKNGQNLYLWSSNNSNQNQHWIFSSLKSTLAEEVISENIQVYPNPVVNGELVIKGINENSTLNVINMQGQVLITKQIESVNELELNVSDKLKTGVYFISIQDSKNTFTQKILVQ